MSTEETKFSRKAGLKNSGLYFWTDLIFFDKEINLRTGSLTFFTLSGIVPITAFGVTVALVLWSRLIPLVGEQLSEFRFTGQFHLSEQES